MINKDWKKSKVPFIQNGKVVYGYRSKYTTTGGDFFFSRKRESVREGIIKLLSFYSKKIPYENIENLIDENMNNLLFYMDNRKSCSPIIFRIILDKEYIDSLENEDLDDSFIRYSFLKIDFTNKINEIIRLLNSYDKILKKKSQVLSKGSISLSLKNEIKNIKSFLSTLEEINIVNEIAVLPENFISFEVCYDEEGNFKALFINNVRASIGETYYKETRTLKSQFLRYIIVNLEKAYDIATEENSKKKKSRWNDFVSEILEDKFNIRKDSSRFQKSVDGVNYFTSGKLNDIKIPCAVKDLLSNEFDQIVENSKVSRGDDCNFIEVDRLKNEFHKNIEKIREEDFIIKSNLKVEIPDNLLRNHEFVGDLRISGLIDKDFSLNDLEEVYDKFLNYVSLEALLKKVSECLPDLGDIENVCIEVYRPFTVNFPDDIVISGLFKPISELALKGVVTISQNIIVSFMGNFFDKLVECENGNLEFYNFVNDADDIFGVNSDLVNNFINVKISENFDELFDARNLVIDGADDIRNLINSIASILTPQELCSLASGNVPDVTMDLIDCIIDNSNVPVNSNDFVNIFADIGNLIDLDTILDKIPLPDQDSYCLPDKRLEARELILNYKDFNIPSEVLQEQLEISRNDLENDINFIKDALSKKGQYDHLFFGDKSPQDFIKDQVPCFKDDPNLRKTVQISVDAMLDSTTPMFVAGMTSVLSNISSAQTPNVYDGEYIKLDEGKIKIGEINFTTQDNTFQLGNFSIDTRKSKSYKESFFQGILNNKSSTNNTIASGSDPFVVINENVIYDGDSSTPESVYNTVMLRFFRKAGSWYYGSSLSNQSSIVSSRLMNEIKKFPVNLFEKAWFDYSSVRKSAVDDFLETQCRTGNNSELYSSLMTGLIGLKIKSKFLTFLVSNYRTISDFDSLVFVDTFVDKLIESEMQIKEEYEEKSRIPVEQYVSNMTSDLTSDISFLFRDFLSSSFSTNKEQLKFRFIEEIPLVESNKFSDVVNVIGPLYLSRHSGNEVIGNDYIDLNIILKKSQGSIEYSTIKRFTFPAIVNTNFPAINLPFVNNTAQENNREQEVKEQLLADEDFNNFFFNVIEFDRILSTFLVVSYRQVKSLDILYETIENLLKNYNSSGDFLFENDDIKIKRNNRDSSNNRKIITDVIKELSLPWILDLIF